MKIIQGIFEEALFGLAKSVINLSIFFQLLFYFKVAIEVEKRR